MCISEERLNKTIVAIREFKSIKKDTETNLKPLEQEVKDYMEETIRQAILVTATQSLIRNRYARIL